MKKILNWIKLNKIEFLILLVILFGAALMRFWRIDAYMTFLGDEGRDAIVIKKILTQFSFPLLGPPTSIGNMYLGPLYYYMMAIPMAIFWLNPVAAAGMVAVIGTLTVGLIYYLSRVWFGKWAAALSAILYAVSPITIFYSRSSWNPNPAPFFTLLSILGLYQSRVSLNFKWFILTGAALAFAIQMHYLALILIPIFGLLWLWELYGKIKKGKIYQSFWLGTISAIIIFLFLMSPLVIFDFRHNFINLRAVNAFFSDRQTTVNLNAFNTTSRIIPIYGSNLISDYMILGNMWLTIIVSILVIIPLLISILRKFQKQIVRWQFLFLGMWLAVGIGGLALYKQTIYPHYLGFLNPVPYLLLGGLIFYLRGIWQKIVVGLLIIVLGFVNLQNNPLLKPPNNQLQRTQIIAQYVIQKSENKPFNFALLAKSNYDAAYQYYLDLYGHKSKQVPFDITDQLFVVCEDQVCQPINNPKYEIAGFGWAKIASEDEILGVKVFKLIHNPDQNKQ